MKSSLSLITPFSVFLALAGCTTGISSDELLREMQEGHAPLVIDVRSRGEFDRDHVPGAIQIPFTFIRSGVQEKKEAKGARLVIYCEHGLRAGYAGLVLYFSGYEKVYSLQGHMKAWREKQFPIESMAH